MKITILGAGQVGGALANQLQQLGHEVTLAVRSPDSPKVLKVLENNSQLAVLKVAEGVSQAEVVFLATPFAVAAETLKSLQAELKGKILVDCTNPVGPRLSHALQSQTSGSETLQALIPETPVIKAFTIYGFENFENNHYPYSIQPAMLFCGDDAEAKSVVGALISELGWEAVDVGGLIQALHLEHMTLMWVRMVRLQGQNPHQVWARLQR